MHNDLLSMRDRTEVADVCCQRVEDYRVTNVWFRYLFLYVYSLTDELC